MTTWLALLLDALLGDPPNRWHPVAWMGSAIARAKRRAPVGDDDARFVYGGLLVVGGAASAAGLAWLVDRALTRLLPRPLAWLLRAGLLSLMLGLRGLNRAATEIDQALAVDDLPEARRLLSWHLVSRDTGTLDESAVSAATIESVAENVSDGVVAPLFWYAVGGLPGVAACRFINTCDAMLGYRDPEHEWLGKVAARTDDALNLVPARLSALSLRWAARLRGEDAASARRAWQLDRRVTASPNAGHPMSTMAGALNVSLEKRGHYVLNEAAPPPQRAHIRRALALAGTSVVLAAVLLTPLALWRRRR